MNRSLVSNVSISLLKNINPNGRSITFDSPIVYVGNGKALFSAMSSPSDRELWITDGTRTGTRQITSIRESGSSSPAEIVSIGDGKALFSAVDDEGDKELWITDGTKRGTQPITEINNRGGAKPDGLTPIGNGKTLFAALDENGDRELWVTDGTAAGTQRIRNIRAEGSASPYLFTPLDNGQALFVASARGLGAELWITNGTEEGTRLVQDISPDGSSRPMAIASIGDGKALFSAEDSAGDRELWITDGTEVGTKRLKDINRNGSSSPENFTSLGNGHTVFSARTEDTNGSVKKDLWVTDGTIQGTRRVERVNRTGSSQPTEITALGNGKALFSATNDGEERDLWITDGTKEGTQQVRSINDGSVSSPKAISPVGNNRAVFSASGGEAGTELWITDGTFAGTQMLADINPVGDSNPSKLVLLGDNKAVFTATDGENKRELWLVSGDLVSMGAVAPTTEQPEQGRLMPAADGLSLEIGDLSLANSLLIDLDQTTLREVSDLLIFRLAKDGTRSEIASFSLLEGRKLGAQFSQKNALPTNLLTSGERLQFELVEQGRTRIGTLALLSNDEIEIDFGRDLSLRLVLQEEESVNMLNGGAESLNLSQFAGETVALDFFVYKDAAFDNTVGFYRTDNASGHIVDEFTGSTLRPGDKGYKEAALLRRLDMTLTGQNGQVSTFTTEIAGGGFVGMYLVADGSDLDQRELYFSHAETNLDANDHVKFLGSNTFGFEDSVALGDRDFNDMVVQFEARVV